LIKSTELAPFISYFEPELEGSLTPTRRFWHLISVVPHEVSSGSIWKTRRDFEKNQLLKGRGPEVALVESLAVVFFFANSWARLWRRQWPQLSLD
jgi:membrane-bound lytic murein transglycosylase A